MFERESSFNKILLSFAEIFIAFFVIATANAKTFSPQVELDIHMPSIPAVEGIDEIYLCTAIRLPEPDKTLYATGFHPKATKKNVHHLVLYGTSEPPGLENDNQAVWPCGFDPTNGTLYPGLQVKVKPGQPTEKMDEAIIFDWGSEDEPDQILPNGVGFKLGADTRYTHLMLLVHYRNLDNKNDNTGVTVNLTSEKQPFLAGVLAYGSEGTIPPHQTVAWEGACLVPLGWRLHPFSYRVHTHYLGKVVAGYIVDNTRGNWTLIGKKDPSLPQINEDQNDNLIVNGGDYLVVRCTFVSHRDETTVYGPTEMKEMCVFLLMFYIDPNESILPEDSWPKMCTTDPWESQFKNIPKDASEIDGIQYLK